MVFFLRLLDMPAESCCMTTHLTSTISSGKLSLPLNPASRPNLRTGYLVPLTIASAFLTGALYLCLYCIIIVYGQQISRFSPRTYTITFMTSDFISLVLHGAGAGLTATTDDNSGSETGRAIMVAGVMFQVVSLLIFMDWWLEFIFRLHRTSESAKDVRFLELRVTKKFT
ncbi:Sphingoid long-chain base transporter [Lachnellula subtilissima]|uniref:Sphingoid long-chain base transporter n=1 Tax=Lachnellula subtilissima TaxID=602034 RepID=A0A8H8S2E6_9HELO|nr:Sphingoid long-chain base transporter [Lachnellula subtilissima]